ncbi:hypothetical protein HanPI659440_Chr04g0177521 [Helianthus annuus]|nr:hypothetical protein HanPI659440_Chr04g0177521 [Helianthus annuus]
MVSELLCSGFCARKSLVVKDLLRSVLVGGASCSEIIGGLRSV